MTALELNAELFRQLSIIAEDETLMRKAVEAIRRLAQQKEAQTEETEYISKEEVACRNPARLNRRKRVS